MPEPPHAHFFKNDLTLLKWHQLHVTSSKHTIFIYTFLHSFIHLKTVTQMDSFKYKQTYISSAAITHLIRIYWSPYIIMKVL